MQRLISKTYADERRRLIDPARALAWDQVPSYGSLAGDTVYVAAVDAAGNAASLIFSLYGVFGSCVTSGATGSVHAFGEARAVGVQAAAGRVHPQSPCWPYVKGSPPVTNGKDQATVPVPVEESLT